MCLYGAHGKQEKHGQRWSVGLMQQKEQRDLSITAGQRWFSTNLKDRARICLLFHWPTNRVDREDVAFRTAGRVLVHQQACGTKISSSRKSCR